MYPRIRCWAVQEGASVQDSPYANKTSGWIKVEATVNAPNINTTQADLEKHAKDRKYFPQRLNTFILASQASKDLAEKYLDEALIEAREIIVKGTTTSRLGSCCEIREIKVNFYADGSMGVGLLEPDEHYSEVGGRFEQVKKFN